MKKSIVLPLAILIIIIVGLIVAKQTGVIGKEIKQKVEVEKVALRTITETITANGKIHPKVEVKVSSDVSGEILELNIKEGDRVKTGDVLAKIQPDIYLRNKEKMEASVLTAQANLEQTIAQFNQKELSFNRNTKLWKEQTIPDSEYEQALADYNIAKANVTASKSSLRNAKASLSEAEDNLSRTTIYAPMDGTVSRLNVEKGERVVGTGQFEGTDMMTIANLHAMEVVVDVNENDIIRVNLNDTALIEVDAYLKKTFKGLVTQIANSAKTEGTSADQVTNFEVKILMLPESYENLRSNNDSNYFPFRPGMSATVDIQTNTKRNIVSVPIQSVTTREDTVSTNDKKKKLEVIFLVKNDTIVQQIVEAGIQNDNYIELISNIDTSETVVSGPYSAISKKLKDGDLVEIMTE